MTEYWIEGALTMSLTIPNHVTHWRLYAKASSLEEARNIAAKAIQKTKYMTIRIREKA
jgi:hypothetical protein